MNNLLSIGEVAKLKNLTVETLRHYDRIGLLKPKYTNPNTSYRYYDAHQLFQIDIIGYCKLINLPLNEIKSIFEKADNNEFIDFLEVQKLAINNEINTLKNAIYRINKLQNRMVLAQGLSDEEGIYYRFIDKREIVYFMYDGDCTSCESRVTYSLLNKYLSDNNLVNLYQGGFIHSIDGSYIKSKVIFECIKDESNVDCAFKVTIPAGNYMCLNYGATEKNTALKEFSKLIADKGLKEKDIIDTYIISDFFDANKIKNELQIYVD